MRTDNVRNVAAMWQNSVVAGSHCILTPWPKAGCYNIVRRHIQSHIFILTYLSTYICMCACSRQCAAVKVIMEKNELPDSQPIRLYFQHCLPKFLLCPHTHIHIETSTCSASFVCAKEAALFFFFCLLHAFYYCNIIIFSRRSMKFPSFSPLVLPCVYRTFFVLSTSRLLSFTKLFCIQQCLQHT